MSTLLAPETRPGCGSGHIRRALRLFEGLPESRLLLPPDRGHLDTVLRGVDTRRIVERVEGSWDRIVVDRYRVERDEILELTRHGFTIGIDLGGPGRAYCDYLVDMLPRVDRETANECDPCFLEVAEPVPGTVRKAGTILVSFGGEDPARLTEPTVALLCSRGRAADLTVIAPSMRKLDALPAGVRVLEPQASVATLLAEHEWVVTGFGMTALEARHLGAGVVTIAPTLYHDRLARVAGFARAGIGGPRARALMQALRGPLGSADAGSPERRRSLAAHIAALPAPERRGCPAHPGVYGPALRRYPQKSYFQCPRCGLRYLERFARDEQRYGTEYFMEEYRLQYGRTYLEDFDHIAEMGRLRVDRARALKPDIRTVLDVGCAYGPFLAAAREEGLEPYGIDVASDAIAHVCKLGIPAACGSILDTDVGDALGRRSFDLVSLWYVVEHFDRLDLLLPRLRDLVRPGGLLALATPNASGVSGRCRGEQFYRDSPRDHFTVWDRQSAARVLAEHGLLLRRTVITGHHPERYPPVAAGIVPAAMARIHSRLFGWGDTFEVYAQREGA